MKKFLNTLFILPALVLGIISAETLVELCQDVCVNAGMTIDEYKNEFPECATKFMKDKGYFEKKWSCEDVRSLSMDLVQTALMMKSEGKEKEFGECVKEVAENVVTVERVNEFMEKVNDPCKEKVFAILDYIRSEVGDI